MRSMVRWAARCLALVVYLGATGLAHAAADDKAIGAALASKDRLDGDAAEDAWRNPQAVLNFLGVHAGQHTLDYFAAAGYYSELLSRVVGPTGSVIVYNNPGYAEFAGTKLTERVTSARLPNAHMVTTPTDALKLQPASLDSVLFVLSYHDLYWTPKGEKGPLGAAKQVTADLFKALKKGGVVVVVDHAARPGSDTATVVNAMHRIDPQKVKDDFARAGFSFDEASNALRHPDDDLSKPVFDESIRHKTDQFILRFRKP